MSPHSNEIFHHEWKKCSTKTEALSVFQPRSFGSIAFSWCNFENGLITAFYCIVQNIKAKVMIFPPAL